MCLLVLRIFSKVLYAPSYGRNKFYIEFRSQCRIIRGKVILLGEPEAKSLDTLVRYFSWGIQWGAVGEPTVRMRLPFDRGGPDADGGTNGGGQHSAAFRRLVRTI